MLDVVQVPIDEVPDLRLDLLWSQQVFEVPLASMATTPVPGDERHDLFLDRAEYPFDLPAPLGAVRARERVVHGGSCDEFLHLTATEVAAVVGVDPPRPPVPAHRVEQRRHHHAGIWRVVPNPERED